MEGDVCNIPNFKLASAEVGVTLNAVRMNQTFSTLEYGSGISFSEASNLLFEEKTSYLEEEDLVISLRNL